MIKLFEQFNNESEIHYICDRYDIKSYTINSDGSVDVDGDVDLDARRLIKLPLKFNKVYGNFNCSLNRLSSLEGSPNYVGGYFNCGNNQLESLENSPEYIGGYFYCSSNRLTSLEGSPNYVGSDFYCKHNLIITLKGCPKYINANFSFEYNPINKIDVEVEIEGIILLDNTNLDDKIIHLYQYHKRMLFKHGLDYNIFDSNGSINDKQLQHFLNDFKEEDD